MNKNGFTLIELLAVVVILGVIMTIAIPNVVSTIDKNKKESMIEDAKQLISSAEYKIKSDTSIKYPDANSLVVIKASSMDNLDLEVSPFDTYYCPDKTFVAITKEKRDGVYEYVYYVHVVSAKDKECNINESNESYVHGIELSERDMLSSSDRFDLVGKGSEINYTLIDDEGILLSYFGASNVKIY